jgi:glutaredoxin 3
MPLSAALVSSGSSFGPVWRVHAGENPRTSHFPLSLSLSPKRAPSLDDRPPSQTTTGFKSSTAIRATPVSSALIEERIGREQREPIDRWVASARATRADAGRRERPVASRRPTRSLTPPPSPSLSRAPPAPPTKNKQEDAVKATIDSNKVAIFSKTYCPYCTKAKALFSDTLKVPAKVVELDALGAEGAAMEQALKASTGMRTFPQVFVSSKLVGGCDGEYLLLFVVGVFSLLGCFFGGGGTGCRFAFLFASRALSLSFFSQKTKRKCKRKQQNQTATMAAHQSGELKTMLAAAGISI